jgi:glycosyltransferase involved in cell wall biosynthesis
MVEEREKQTNQNAENEDDRKKKSARLAIVVPCYNEEEVLPDTMAQLEGLLVRLSARGKISKNSFLLFVDDGSRDQTWEIIERANEENSKMWGIKLAQNRGHQNALLAGLMRAKEYADITVSIDADLQDDIDVIEEMVDKYYLGCEIVFGVRNDRTTDSFFKRTTANGFYRLMEILGTDTVKNHADFRLMSRRAVMELEKYKERNMFLRCIVKNIGFQTDCVYYARKERTAGESKYPLKKMITFALEGITSFSTRPILCITIMGFLSLFVSLVAILYSIFGHFFGYTVSGWTSLFCSVWFLGGLQLLAIGIVGEYIGKIYMETKERPRYAEEIFLSRE